VEKADYPNSGIVPAISGEAYIGLVDPSYPDRPISAIFTDVTEMNALLSVLEEYRAPDKPAPIRVFLRVDYKQISPHEWRVLRDAGHEARRKKAKAGEAQKA
jgi:hypothetical protein